jgi:3-oxoadipate enol-lactonase
MSVPLAHRVDGPPDAPAVLLAPSLGTTWEMWDELAAALTSTYRVVRFDTRGHGRSPVPAGPWTVVDLAGDVLALADTLGIERFGFVGLSLGGAIGQTLGVTAPERLASAVLCCTVPVFGDPTMWAERATQVRAEGMGALAEATKDRWFTPGFRAAHPDVVDRFVAMLTGVDPEGYAACCEALGGFDLRDQLGRIATPTRVVAGAEDPVATLEACTAMADAIPGADLVVIDDASHIASAAQPAAFHAAVLEHLDRHR